MAYQADPLGDFFQGLFNIPGTLLFGPQFNTQEALEPSLARLDAFNNVDDINSFIDGIVSQVGADNFGEGVQQQLRSLAQRHFENPSDRDAAAAFARAIANVEGQAANIDRQAQVSSLGDTFLEDLEGLFSNPNSVFGEAVASARNLRDTPVFDEQEILSQIGRGQGALARSGNAQLRNITSDLASRGVNSSVAAGDLLSNARINLSRDLDNLAAGIATNAATANSTREGQGADLLGRLAGLETSILPQAQQFVTGLKAGNVGTFDPSSFSTTLQNVGSELEQADVFNQNLFRGTTLENIGLVENAIANLALLSNAGGNSGGQQQSSGGFSYGLNLGPVSLGGVA